MFHSARFQGGYEVLSARQAHHENAEDIGNNQRQRFVRDQFVGSSINSERQKAAVMSAKPVTKIPASESRSARIIATPAGLCAR
jgi:hypothetical protein